MKPSNNRHVYTILALAGMVLTLGGCVVEPLPPPGPAPVGVYYQPCCYYPHYYGGYGGGYWRR